MRHKRIHLISAYSQLHYGNMATISKKTFDLHLSDRSEDGEGRSHVSK